MMFDALKTRAARDKNVFLVAGAIAALVFLALFYHSSAGQPGSLLFSRMSGLYRFI